MKKSLLILMLCIIALAVKADTPTKLSLVFSTSYKTTFSIQSPVSENFSLSGHKQIDYDSFLSVGSGIMLVGTITVDRPSTLKIHFYQAGDAVYTKSLSKGQNVIYGDFIPYSPTVKTRAFFYITVTPN